VASWSVAGVEGFVLAVLKRWQRHHGALPREFSLVMCPQVELNAMGGLPDRVTELTDPRLRCRYFTGCHRPYFVVIFDGDDAETRRAEVQEVLSWSEGYRVQIEAECVVLHFMDATEDFHDEAPQTHRPRTLQDLLASGDLIRILA
jgi:hypothetical protein